MSCIKKTFLSGIIAVVSMTGPVSAECPIIITNVYELQAMQDDLDGWYELGCDIDASETRYWNDGGGFVPIGTFTGIFDGQGFSIKNLYINRINSRRQALFSIVSGGGTIIKNVNLIDVDITCNKNGGSLAGIVSYSAVVTNCSATGTLTLKSGSTDTKSGGLIGTVSFGAHAEQSFSGVNVNASSRMQVGSLIGYLRGREYYTLLSNSYSYGTVTGNGAKQGNLLGDADGSHVDRCYSCGYTKALIGYNYQNPVITNSYWDRDKGAASSPHGGTPKTTAEMMQQSTFVNWDFVNIWDIVEDETYPYLIGDFELYKRLHHVDANAPDDPAPGIPGENVGEPGFSDPNEDGSLDHPFDSIQKAIDDSINCATIIVRDAIYRGVGNYDIDFGGLMVTVKSQNGPNDCIIDCQGQGRAFIFQSGEDANTVIDGFTITGGYSSETGGGIYCYGSSPIIENCIITDNYAAWSGGGIFLEANSNVLVSRCTITNNACEGSGAGICSVGSSPTIKNCIIAYNDGDLSGGASSIYDGNMTFINCTIADNSASHLIGTGGIYCWEADANITNTILWDNNSYNNNQIERFQGDETIIVSYSDVQIVESNDVWEGIDNINTDPLFARAEFGDYHLKSEAGRWELVFQTNGDFNNDGIINFIDLEIFTKFWLKSGPDMIVDLDYDDLVNLYDFAIFALNWLKPGENIGGWLLDDVTSPCIDAGDSSSDYSLEPAPNGGRINMGAYGNTEQASKSPP